MEGHVYHWKHGWIPLTHTAAMVKAKGSRSGAASYAKRYGIADNRLEGRERRQGGSVDLGDKRKREERGTFQYKPGTRTRDYPQRPGGPVGEPPAGVGGPKSAAEAFKMKRHELEPHAKAGNPHAQGELDRRAAKRGGAAPAKPKAAPAGPSLDRKDPNPDARLAPNPERDAETAKALQGKTDSELEVLRKNLREGSSAHTAVLAEQKRRGGLPKPKHISEVDDKSLADEVHRRGGAVVGGKFYPGMARRGTEVPARNPDLDHLPDEALANELARRGGGVSMDGKHVPGSYAGPQAPKAPEAPAPFTEAPKPANPFTPEAKAAREAEDRQIEKALPHGHSVRATGMASGGTYSRHYDAEGNSLGTVSGSGLPGSKWTAEHNQAKTGKKYEFHRKDLGKFDTREEAHKAIADADAAHKLATAQKEAKAKAAAAKRSSGLAGLPGPHGTTWEPHTLESDGTFSGKLAAAKVKQAFKAGDHTVVIESVMSPEKTKAFLGDVTTAVEKSTPNLKGTGVKFLVPTGDSHFRASPKGVTGAYVRVGGTTVHVNPRVANGDLSEAFTNAAHRGHFMPAGKANAREYTLVHELGHVADGQHQHTRSLGMLGSFDPGVSSHFREHAPHGSKYGRENAAEGYAEAFAQWHIGGQGSHQVSDAYAERFGWAPPATTSKSSGVIGGDVTDARDFHSIK